MDDYVQSEQWSADHWSTLAYMETVMVECGGFQIGRDPRMRSNRAHFRVMQEQCPNPKRPSRDPAGVVMKPEHGTRLRDGTVLPGHDDWCCLQDMAAAGYLTCDVEDAEPGVSVHLSELGQLNAAALRSHKAHGGKFADFRAVVPETAPVAG